MGDQPYIGTMSLFAGSFAPRGWSFCNGALLPIGGNQALFALLGTQFGGNGVSNFALPDLRGRVPIGAGNGGGLTPRAIGQAGGVENVSLSITEMPVHTHGIRVIPSEGTSSVATDGVLAKSSRADAKYAKVLGATAAMASTSILPTGAGVAHLNVQPSVALNWIIATAGLFPPRP